MQKIIEPGTQRDLRSTVSDAEGRLDRKRVCFCTSEKATICINYDLGTLTFSLLLSTTAAAVIARSWIQNPEGNYHQSALMLK